MHPRYRFVPPLVVIGTALAVSAAFAAKPAPTTLSTQPRSQEVVPHTTFPCQLGVFAPSNTAFGYILAPDDAYYTLINSSDCAICGAGPSLLTAAHVEHFFPVGELPCDIAVKVSIVAAVDPGDGCLAPNPFEQLCPQTCYVIGYPGIDDVCVDFSMPLPANCCINRPAFLEIEYAATECGGGDTCPSGRPAFCGQNPDITGPCHQYNIYPGGNDDLSLALSRNVTMWTESYCCPCCVPTVPQSWGKVKTLYR